jgi:tetraacyldisaccharide 4'-kinase
MHYNDHHIFSFDDCRDIKKRFEVMDAEKKVVLTTEKDAMRLLKFNKEINGMPFYVIPIEHRFLFSEGTAFNEMVVNFIKHFKQPVKQ